MNVTLKMNINDQEFELKCDVTNAAGRIYRQQYNRDLLIDMKEIYKKTHKTELDALSAINMEGIDVETLSADDLSKALLDRVDISKLMAMQEEETLSFEETDRCGQIVWAFVKNADKDTPRYEEWIDSFDFILPVIDIVCALYEAWTKSAQPTIQLKN